MLSIKNVIILSCALLGAAVAEKQAEKGCTKPVVNRNVRPCSKKPAPCHPANPNKRVKPGCCPKPCSSSSSSKSSCSCTSWYSSDSEPIKPIYSSESCSSSSSSVEPCSSSSSSESCPSSSSSTSCPSSSSTSCPSSSSYHCNPVQLEVNGGWYKFKFGPAGSSVSKRFDFVTVGPSVLRITDMVCSGDAFSVYDNGNLILQTPFVGGDNCRQANHEVGPHRAYDSEHHSHGRVNLAPGAHSIKVVVARAPEKHGVGAIRVDSVMAACPHELNGLRVINTPVPYSKAKGVCKSLGLKLADLNIYNFLDATTLAFQCAGAFSASWIGSYWKNDYEGIGIALYTGAMAPGGSINVPASQEEHLPVICQAHSDDECSSSSSSSCSESSSCSCSYANHNCVCCECSQSTESSCSESSTVEPSESSCSKSSSSSSSHCRRH